MIIRATTRPADDHDGAVRTFDVERPDYEGCLAVVRAEVPPTEVLLHIQVDRG